MLWLAACLFLGDVAVRRIALDVDRIKQAASTNGRSSAARRPRRPANTWTSCRNRKAEVNEQLDRTRAAAPGPRPLRLRSPDAPASGPIGEPLLEGGAIADRARAGREDRRAPASPTPSPETAKQSYTNRLLKAKQRVWEEREKDKEPDKKTTRRS